MQRGLYCIVGPKFYIGAPRKERMMKGKEIEILEKFRQLTDENKTIILACLATVLSAPTASPSDRPRDDAPTA